MRFKLLIYITIQTCAIVFHKGIAISICKQSCDNSIKESDNTSYAPNAKGFVNSGSLLRRLEDFIHC